VWGLAHRSVRAWRFYANKPCEPDPKLVYVPQTAPRAQDVPHYIHAEHMYEAWNIKHKHLKWGVAITLFVSIPFGIPFFAVYWQQKKMAG
jgi:hypothetical protein